VLVEEGEGLDLAGRFGVCAVACGGAWGDRAAPAPPFNVVPVGRDPVIVTRYGLRVSPDYRFRDCPPLDLLIVPGGVVHDPVRDPQTLAFVAQRADAADCVASVCAGAFVLAAAGVLVEGAATTHWEDVDDLRAAHPALDVQTGAAFVRGARAVTSAGAASGISMSLALVADFCGADLADRTAAQIEVGSLRQGGLA